ncbi:MAG: secondary thiamine-phosphate synthase enzyme YjbQ [Bacillota bacterium]|jgi:secondary thiamine-phosphate synthase enzyme|nr:secondary thiamine-phosphate synthase enzyme YjbQ [Bacillota bacterium]
MLQKFSLRTDRRSQMTNITEKVENAVREARIQEGLVCVYCPHTTAGITINEGADPDVASDMLTHLDEHIPWERRKYRHAEGNSAAHLKASIIGSSQTIPVAGGNLVLGTWQAIYFCEFDGPRNRTFWVKIITERPAGY